MITQPVPQLPANPKRPEELEAWARELAIRLERIVAGIHQDLTALEARIETMEEA